MRIPKPLTKLKNTWLWRHRGKLMAYGPFVIALVIYLSYVIYNYRAKANYEAVMDTWYQYEDTTSEDSTAPSEDQLEDSFFTHPAFLAEKNGSHTEEFNSPTRTGYSGFAENAAVFTNDRKGSHLMGISTDLSLWFDPVIKGSQRELALHGLQLLEPFQTREQALRQAASMPNQAIPKAQNPEDHSRITMEYSSVGRGAASYFSSKAILHIHAGQGTEALTNTIAQIQIANHFQQAGTLIDFLLYNAFSHVVSHSVWEGLHANIWDDAQLLSLERHLEKIDLRQLFIQSMRGEFIYTANEIQKLIDNPKHLDEQQAKFSLLVAASGSTSWKETAMEYARKAIPHGWYVQQYAELLKAFDEVLLHPQGVANYQLDISHHRAFMERENPLKEQWFNDIISHSPTMGVYARQVTRALQGQAMINNMRVAIAIERYRLAEGKYPATLASLAPKFLATIPTDVVNGQPLQYRIKSDGTPLIYSIGINETDDNGHPNRDREAADWAWMYSPPSGFTYDDYRARLSN